MTEATLDRRAVRGGSIARRGALAGTLVLPLLLGACSSFLFGDEDLEPQRIELTTQRAKNPDFPNLASVPEQAPQPSASAQRQEMVTGLLADRQNARYSDQPLTPQTAAEAADGDADLSYPPPPAVAAPTTSTPALSQTAANTAATAAAGPASQAAPQEPEMPPPPPGPPASDSEPAPAALNVPPPPTLTRTAEAPPPASAPAPEGTANSDLTYPAPTGLLQEKAFQQQALAQQRMQQLAMQRQAFDQQARQQAIEQQWQREQIIQQQTSRWRYPAAQQLAAVPPVAPAAGVAAPAAIAPRSYEMPGAAPGAALTAPPPVAPGAPGQLVGLIYFGHGSARLDSHDREVLRQVAALQQTEGRGLVVIGHASARTGAMNMAQHEEKNLKMSMHRAKAVADLLVQLGADGSRIAVDGRGDLQPVYHEFTSAGEAGNRRVEIYLE